MVRRNGSLLIFNDEGSGWKATGPKPSDAYLIARRRAATPYDVLIHRECRSRGVDPALVKTVMLIESAYNPRARSPKGASGLMQLMPATARQYGVSNIFEPLENIRGAIGYLADLLDLYSGDIPRTLAAYNAGSKAVSRYGGIPPYAETREYVRRGMVALNGASLASDSPFLAGTALPDPVAPAINGSFRGQIASAAVARMVRARTATGPAVVAVASNLTPVSMNRFGRVLSNAAMPDRPVPRLGRVTTP